LLLVEEEQLAAQAQRGAEEVAVLEVVLEAGAVVLAGLCAAQFPEELSAGDVEALEPVGVHAGLDPLAEAEVGAGVDDAEARVELLEEGWQLQIINGVSAAAVTAEGADGRVFDHHAGLVGELVDPALEGAALVTVALHALQAPVRVRGPLAL